MSWNETDFSKALSKQPMVMTMQFVVRTSGTLSDMISLSDKVAIPEAYGEGDEIMDLRLGTRAQEGQLEFALYQNEPNPWTGTTSIGFDLPEDGMAKLTLFDMTGKTIKVIENYYKAGSQSIQLLKRDVPGQGVLYYRLECGNYSATKKMIRIE